MTGYKEKNSHIIDNRPDKALGLWAVERKANMAACLKKKIDKGLDALGISERKIEMKNHLKYELKSPEERTAVKVRRYSHL